MTHEWVGRMMFAAALLLGARARSAEATPPPALLAVRTAESVKDCPDAAALAERVNEITGWPSMVTARRSDVRLELEVELSANDAGHAAIIRAKGSRSGERHIADIGTNCAGLADALAVTLAIIVDDERVAPADGVPTPKLVRAEPPISKPAPAPEPIVTWRPYLALSTTLGALEAIAFGPAVGLAFERDRLVIAADGWWLPSRTFQLDPGEADVSLLAATVHGCWKTFETEQRMWLALCAQVSAGRLSGSGRGFSQNRSAHRPWVAPGVGAFAATPFAGSLEGFGAVKLMAPVHRERFVVDNLGAAHETPPLGLHVAIGVSMAIR